MAHHGLRSLSLVLSLLWCLTTSIGATEHTTPQIHQVLPKDAIGAILTPAFVHASEAQIEDRAAMIGVVLNGEAHGYSAVLLNSHEIVNDEVGGVKIATTW